MGARGGPGPRAPPLDPLLRWYNVICTTEPGTKGSMLLQVSKSCSLSTVMMAGYAYDA